MESKFHDALSITEYRSDRWFLNHDYRYTTNVTPYRWMIVVPALFPTDLASIPQIFQSLIPKIGRHRGPAVIHDWLIHRNPYVDEVGRDGILRCVADQIFLEAMQVAGVPLWKRTAMYQAVRLYSALTAPRKNSKGASTGGR